ncbi:MAG: hypothetical protein U5P10_02935 [Spirochaetia bacterium]|nr:hypothetical protein [Spirochaetia bacterium]
MPNLYIIIDEAQNLSPMKSRLL